MLLVKHRWQLCKVIFVVFFDIQPTESVLKDSSCCSYCSLSSHLYQVVLVIQSLGFSNMDLMGAAISDRVERTDRFNVLKHFCRTISTSTGREPWDFGQVSLSTVPSYFITRNCMWDAGTPLCSGFRSIF